jgi:hypothetical protein
MNKSFNCNHAGLRPEDQYDTLSLNQACLLKRMQVDDVKVGNVTGEEGRMCDLVVQKCDLKSPTCDRSCTCV